MDENEGITAESGGRGAERLLEKKNARIAELKAALLAVIHAYDDDEVPDPERALSDAVQAARAVWRGDSQ